MRLRPGFSDTINHGLENPNVTVYLAVNLPRRAFSTG
jgi:hypothetical protein